MFISYAPRFGVVPTHNYPDTDETWNFLLGNPEVREKDGPCIRFAGYFEGANAPTAMNVIMMGGALFDIDEGDIPSPQQLAVALEGHRVIIAPSYNSTPEAPRYSLMVPFAEPVYPWEYKYLWEQINNVMLGGRCSPSQANLDRLRFLPALKSEAARVHYRYWIFGGENRLNPKTRFPDYEAHIEALVPYVENVVLEPDKTDWYTEEEAAAMARGYFQNVGPGIQAGGRHAELFKIGCKLCWDYCLSSWEVVAAILQEINQRFPEPKPMSQVLPEVEAAFARTRGKVAVKQIDFNTGEEKELGCKRKKPPALTLTQVRKLAAIEKKSNDIERRDLGQWLSNVASRKSIASVQERDQALRMTARFLGTKFTEHDPLKTAERVFLETIAISNSEEAWDKTINDAAQYFEGGQRQVRLEKEKRIEKENEHRAASIKRALGNGRTTPYSSEEVQSFADRLNVSVDEFRKLLIVSVGNSHYVFVNGDYIGPITKDNICIAVVDYLSPMLSVQLGAPDPKTGELRYFNRDELMRRYGTLAKKGIVDLTAQRSYYDQTTDTFVEAPCPLRDIKPERIPIVEAWLNTFPETDKINEWLANVTRLDRPASALYLCGPPSSGKTLLAYALGRLFQLAGMSSIGDYFETFNEEIVKNPILLADETLPRQLRGRRGHERFRELIQAPSRPLKRKFLSSMTLQGYFRFILLSNNDGLLTNSGLMNSDDESALEERLLFVRLSGAPAEFLKKLTPEQRQAFVSEDLVAKHALWLRDNLETSEHRFVVSGGSSDVTRRLGFDGVKGDVLNFLYRILTENFSNPNAAMSIDMAGAPEALDHSFFPILVERGANILHVAANAHDIYTRWHDVMGTGNRAPPLLEIQDTLGALAVPIKGKSVRKSYRNKQTRYRVVDTQFFMEWAEQAGIGDDGVAQTLQDIFPKQHKENSKMDRFFDREEE